jgi:hypothetical protein
MDESIHSTRAELDSKAKHTRVEFLQVELEAGLTFAHLAQTEYFMDDWMGAKQAGANARQACNVVQKHLPMAHPDEQERKMIGERLKELEQALEDLAQLEQKRAAW